MNGLKRHPFSRPFASFWRVWATRQMTFHTNKWRDWITKQGKYNITKICFLTLFNTTALTWEKRPRIEDPFNLTGLVFKLHHVTGVILLFSSLAPIRKGRGKRYLVSPYLSTFFFSDFTRDFFVLSGSKSVLRSDSWIFFLDLSKEWTIRYFHPLIPSFQKD